MFASTEWEAISQAFFFGSPATGMGMQGGRAPLPGAGAGSPGRRGRPGVAAGPSPPVRTSCPTPAAIYWSMAVSMTAMLLLALQLSLLEARLRLFRAASASRVS